MAVVSHNWKDYNVDDNFLASFKELVDLILVSSSIKENQKQFWFDIVISMPETELDKLFDVLTREKKEIERIHANYKTAVKDLHKQHLIAWQKKQSDEKREAIQKEEHADKSNPDEVLWMLDDL